jgi:hypothetical protein
MKSYFMSKHTNIEMLRISSLLCLERPEVAFLLIYLPLATHKGCTK